MPYYFKLIGSDNAKYSFVELADIQLKDADKYFSVAEKAPKHLNYDDPDYEESWREFLKEYLLTHTTLTVDVIDKISVFDSGKGLNQFNLYEFIEGYLNNPNKNKGRITSFEFDGVKYNIFTPSANGTVGDVLFDLEIKSLSEELKKGSFKNAAKLLALICLPEGENMIPLDSDKRKAIITSRSKIFQELDMDFTACIFRSFFELLLDKALLENGKPIITPKFKGFNPNSN